MRLNYKLLLLIFFIPVITRAQYEQLASVNIGDPAPSLRVEEWIKGAPVLQFEKGKVYVLEFWATWCRPCLAAMPHLSALAQEYKEKVSVIAIDIYESKLKPKKSNKQVKAFVDSIGDKMNFNVAIEDSNFTVADWIIGTGEERDGIPRTFVVDADGKLAWIGHPSQLDNVLPKIVSKSWDAKQELARRNLNMQLAMLDDSLQYELGRFFKRTNPDVYEKGKPDSALLVIDEWVKKEPNLKYAPQIARYTFSCLLETDAHKAYEYGKMAIKTPSYSGEPPYNVIIYLIEWYSSKLKLPAEIYELGADAYQVEIDQIVYPELVNMSRIYKGMAEMYWRANNKVKAIEAQQKAIDALKSRKDFSKKDLTTFQLKLQQYKEM
jgi:thiol-disulfide isomerase/thioredoxin